MSEQILSPKMLGYWTEETLREAPDESGIYCVFRAAVDPESEEMEAQELLYVGEHRSARYGLQHDGHRDRWLAFAQEGEEIWYSVGLSGHVNRERLAAAMINAHKPRFNADSEFLDRFPYDDTQVHIYGKKEKLQSIFTVERHS